MSSHKIRFAVTKAENDPLDQESVELPGNNTDTEHGMYK